MDAMPAYSTLFQCLYDQPAPVGALGNGSHYSVFRTFESHDVDLRPCAVRQIHDFAVIWDIDHDVRVIRVAEALIANNLFSPVQFIGEQQGTLRIIVAARTLGVLPDETRERYFRRLQEVVAQAMPDDQWTCVIGKFDRNSGSHRNVSSHQNEPERIVTAPEHVTVAFLTTIDAQWNLGTRDWDYGFGYPPGTWSGVGRWSMQRDHSKLVT